MKPIWMKPKGYLHLTPSLHINTHWKKYKALIENPEYIGKYAFYPLIHTAINERKYKKIDQKKYEGKGRSHKHKRKNSGKIEKTVKKRPLHYATHFDALIYSYYGSLLSQKYEETLQTEHELNNAVTAYRKIKVSEECEKGKSTIHFAKEVFYEIEERSKVNEEVCVLAFDITNFFSSLNHSYLKDKWIEFVGEEEFYRHHFNVFKACTRFSYVLLRDLRNNKKRAGFQENKLAKIRRENGHECFFESNNDFRKAIKEGKLRIYKNQFYQKTENGKVNTGIPQGLPLSAILANIYLIDFDKKIVETVVKKQQCFYRRYSDDLIIICTPTQKERVLEQTKELIEEIGLKISTHKTDEFIFKYTPFNGSQRLCCAKIKEGEDIKFNNHLTYLGFEFRGYNTTIKSSNLSKYYRRIISVVKRRAKRAYQSKKKDPSLPYAVYLNQIKKLVNKPVKIKDNDKEDKKSFRRGKYELVQKENGLFKCVNSERPLKHNSNYFSYVLRCSNIFEDDIFKRQIRKRKKITFQAIKKHLAKFENEF